MDLLTKDEYNGVAAYEFEGQLYDRLVVQDVRLKEQQLKAAQKAVEIAKLGTEQAKQNAALSQQNIEKAQKSVEQAELTLDQAVKAVSAAQKQLEYASIVAPFDGTIAGLEIKQGDYVADAGISTAPPVYMVNPASLEIDTNIDEIDIADVRPGQKAVIQLDTFPGSAYDGVVDSISLTPVVNPQSPGVVIYSVKIKFAGSPPPEIRSGMSANIDIITREKKGVLLVPNKSIDRTGQDQGTVSVLNGEKVEPRQVVLGSTDGIQTEVVSGLQDGDVILSLSAGSQAG
jgi:RND family efflux transporter MFP subunit